MGTMLLRSEFGESVVIEHLQCLQVRLEPVRRFKRARLVIVQKAIVQKAIVQKEESLTDFYARDAIDDLRRAIQVAFAHPEGEVFDIETALEGLTVE